MIQDHTEHTEPRSLEMRASHQPIPLLLKNLLLGGGGQGGTRNGTPRSQVLEKLLKSPLSSESGLGPLPSKQAPRAGAGKEWASFSENVHLKAEDEALLIQSCGCPGVDCRHQANRGSKGQTGQRAPHLGPSLEKAPVPRLHSQTPISTPVTGALVWDPHLCPPSCAAWSYSEWPQIL